MAVNKINKQLVFNIISIVFLVSCILYFGGRLTYHYLNSKKVIKQESNLVATILKKNNEIVTEADGLYKNKDDYTFKGQKVNNYVEYSGYIWRAIKINKNNTVKLVMENPVTALIYGEDTNYLNSNIHKWLNKDEDEANSGIFFDLLNNPYKYLTSTEFCLDILDEDTNNKCKNLIKDQLVTLLNVNDYREMSLEKSFVNNGKTNILLEKDKEDNLLYINEKGLISKSNNFDGFGIKPVITINQRINVREGKGTIKEPIKIEEENNYINKIVKLGDDNWNIISNNNNILKLSLNNYINNTSLPYSNKNSLFDLNNNKNIAYYLNNTYLNSLSYKEKLIDCQFYNSELSDEEGYKYENFFKNQITSKVGLLNMIDIKNNSLTDYYLMNMTTKLGEVAFLYSNNGKNDEALATTKKNVVPVICINLDTIKEGSGTIDNPYLVK